jgi:Protein of unknown function (DUF3025)
MTLAEQLLQIDWQAAWWCPWRGLAQQAVDRVMTGLPVHAALNQIGAEAPVSFVPQSSLPPGMAYEAFIFETRTVPTRDNLHDFFNGLAWLSFPLIKKRLNALQYAEIEQHGVQQLRGPLRDALTVLDENAAFLSAEVHAPVIEALRQHDWLAAFIAHRSLLAEHPPVLLGHALLEKLASPYKAITAHVFPVRHADFKALDACVAEQLGAASLLPKPFVPLPVLGVPGWWPANESPDFYTDRTVFRPPRP